jgi:hypothetical protein
VVVVGVCGCWGRSGLSSVRKQYWRGDLSGIQELDTFLVCCCPQCRPILMEPQPIEASMTVERRLARLVANCCYRTSISPDGFARLP